MCLVFFSSWTLYTTIIEWTRQRIGNWAVPAIWQLMTISVSKTVLLTLVVLLVSLSNQSTSLQTSPKQPHCNTNSSHSRLVDFWRTRLFSVQLFYRLCVVSTSWLRYSFFELLCGMMLVVCFVSFRCWCVSDDCRGRRRLHDWRISFYGKTVSTRLDILYCHCVFYVLLLLRRRAYTDGSMQ